MSWLDTVPVCTDVFVFQRALLCEDCGTRALKDLAKKGVDDDGNSDTFPQGPYANGGGESDGACFCDRGRECINAIEVIPGRKIGCPLGNPLTREGVEDVRESICRDVLSPEKLARRIGRLLRRVWSDHLAPILLRLPASTEKSEVLAKAVRYLLKEEHSKVLPATYTDLDHVYGTATSPYKTTVWRLSITDDGELTDLSCIYLPASEHAERRADDLVADAISEGAWE